jgi:NAD(P)-dependent dehydrogenase (short-subunit alcohol dehydrogenase family)
VKSFQDKTAVITGAGSGIGRSVAIALNYAGAHLAMCDLNQGGLEGTLAHLEDKSLRTCLHQVDVSSLEAMEDFAGEVIDHHGQVDILINNAGIMLIPGPFLNISEDDFKRVVEVNMCGVYNGVRSFLSHLAKQPEACVVIISSLAGLVGLSGYAPYAMSKAAIRGFTESLGMEYARTGVHFMVVIPGGVKTNLVKNVSGLEDDEREEAHFVFTRAATLTPEKTAQKILRGMQKKRNQLVLGVDARGVVAVRRLFPRLYPAILGPVFGQMDFKLKRERMPAPFRKKGQR